jgi:hypothetical protein
MNLLGQFRWEIELSWAIAPYEAVVVNSSEQRRWALEALFVQTRRRKGVCVGMIKAPVNMNSVQTLLVCLSLVVSEV